MGIIAFMSLLFAGALGFGLALFIMATKLDESNNFGDSDGFSFNVRITDADNKVSRSEESRAGYLLFHAPKKPTVPIVPRSDDLVRKSKAFHKVEILDKETEQKTKPAAGSSNPRRRVTSAAGSSNPRRRVTSATISADHADASDQGDKIPNREGKKSYPPVPRGPAIVNQEDE